MSFTFRNLFSEDHADAEPDSAEQQAGDRTANPFSTGEAPARGGQSGGGDGAATGETGATLDVLASELLALIPPAISAQSGIPMSKEIRVPLPADGSHEVSLATIYELCPELFAAEITPLNDSTVTLPPRLGAAKVESRKGEAASSFSSPWGPTPRSGADSEATQAAKTGTPGSEAPQAGGFEMPWSSAKPEEGGALAAGQPGQGKPADGKPDGGAPLWSPAPLAPADGGGKDEPGGDEALFSADPFDGDAFSSGGFATMFSEKAAEDAALPFPGGAGAEAPPPGFGECFLSEKAIPASEPAPGSAGFAPEADPSKADGDADAPAPPSDPAEAMGTEGSVPQGFESPTAPAESAQAEREKPSAPTDEQPAAPAFEGFSAAPQTAVPSAPQREKAAPPAGSSDFALGFAPPAAEPPSAASEPGGDSRAPGDAEAPLSARPEPMAEPPAGFSPPAAPEGAAPTETAAPPVAAKQEPPTAEAGPAPAPAASPATAAAPAEKKIDPFQAFKPVEDYSPAPAAPPRVVPAPSAEADGDSCDPSLRYLELRAIFCTDESFTLAKVARRVVEMPGIEACSLSTPDRFVRASTGGSERSGEEAREMSEAIQKLAALTGLPEARCFTLASDQGTVSLFVEGDCCLTVNHDETAFGPGLRERLILIARSIHKLEN